tara:strand:- start:58 stop:657 length:600 start_codon:yes stop_codon:yes gene_type:complete
MKKLLLSIVSVIFINTAVSAVNYNSDPKIFITELVEDSLKILSDKTNNRKTKEALIEKIALRNVDIKALGMYTLGDVRKTLNDNELLAYSELFQKYFLKSLISRLTEYSSNKFKVLNADQKNSVYTIVNSKVLADANKPEIKIDWRVYTKDPLKPLIRDLIVEGLSLARTQKEEFASILNSNDGDIKFLFIKLEEFIKN